MMEFSDVVAGAGAALVYLNLSGARVLLVAKFQFEVRVSEFLSRFLWSFRTSKINMPSNNIVLYVE